MAKRTCGACKYFNECWNLTMKQNDSEVKATFDDPCEEFDTGKQTTPKKEFPKIQNRFGIHKGNIVVRQNTYDKIIIDGWGRTYIHYSYLTNYEGKKGKQYKANPGFVLSASIVGSSETKEQKIHSQKADIHTANSGDILVIASGSKSNKYDLLIFDYATNKNAKCVSPFDKELRWTVSLSLIKKIIPKKSFTIEDLKII